MKKICLIFSLVLLQLLNIASANVAKEFADSFSSDYKKLRKNVSVENVKKIQEEKKKIVVSEEVANKKEEAYVLYAANKIDESYKILISISEKDMNEQDFLLLSNISLDKKSYLDAISFLGKSIERNKKFYKAYYNLGNIYFEQKKYNIAAEFYRKAISYKRDFAFSYYNLGCAYLKENNVKKAKKSFEKAIQLKDDEPDFYYNLALCYKKFDDAANAQKNIELYDNLIKKKMG